MRQFLSNVRFTIRDWFASRKEAVSMPERREFYRDASDIHGRGLGATSAASIERHTEAGLRPDDA